ncbi:MAG: glycosyltransferase family 2 protein [bacterium]
MKKALCSIIIPLYNASQFIAQTLDSVFTQTYHQIEVICVDNNSSDNSIEIVKKYMDEHHSNITLLKEKKQGAPHARNLGLKHARGDFIQFLDADDYLLPDKIEKQIQFLKQTGADFVTAEHYTLSNNEKKHKQRNFITPWQALISGEIGITSSALFKKECINQIDGFDTTLSSNQEKDLYFRLLSNGFNVTQMKEPVFFKNVHTGSISSQTKKHERLINLLNFLCKIKKHLKENKTCKENRKLLNTRFFFLLEELAKYSTKEANSILTIFGKYKIWSTDFSILKKAGIFLLGPIRFFRIYNSLK